MALIVAAAGCGGDEENEERAAPPPPPTTERTAEKRTATVVQPPPETKPAPGAPEEQPGGAGDEEPIRSQALFTGRDGRIRPRLVRVPPFLAVRVELRSADGRRYALRFGRRVLRAGGALSSSSLPLDGLRPGDSYLGVPVGERGSRVRVEASAEPGP